MSSLVLASRGDALTPYLHRALVDRYADVDLLSVDLSAVQRAIVAGTTMRPTRAAWAERFFKSSLGYRLRSRNARRAIGADRGVELVVQVHALFDVPATPTALYVDCTHRQSAQQWAPWNPMSARQLEQWYARERREYQRAEHLFAFCEPTRRSLVEDYDIDPGKVTTVGAGVNFDRLPTLDGRDSRAGRPTLLFIGNDFARKGGQVLLQAFRQVRHAVPDARLRLVGTDPHIADQPGVEVYGRVPERSTIERLYREAAAFVMPSYFDPMPLVVLEAMAFGLPTVASRSCGIPEMVIDGQTGTLVDAGDVDALAAALIDVLSNPAAAAAAGCAGRARVEGRFRWEQVVERMHPAISAVGRQVVAREPDTVLRRSASPAPEWSPTAPSARIDRHRAAPADQ